MQIPFARRETKKLKLKNAKHEFFKPERLTT